MQIKKRTQYRDLDGILLVDKAVGATSNRVLQTVRKGYRARKAGHTGTLDPFASGLLICCFGRATRVSGLLLDADKTYRARLKLGTATDTADCDGAETARAAIPNFDALRLAAIFEQMTGVQQQTPPMYSAVKVDGQRLYELAREGRQVARAAREITIHQLLLLNSTADTVDFEIRCSKGTYVRTVGEDIAAALGTVGHLSALRRLAAGPFDLDRALTTTHLAAQNWPEQHLLGIDQALPHWPACRLDEQQCADFVHGRQVLQVAPGADWQTGCDLRIYDQNDLFLGCGRWDDTGVILPKRLFVGAYKG